MNTEIVSPKTMDEVSQLGKVFRASGFFPEITNEAQAVVKILAGQELNISPMQAMQNIFVIPSKQGASIQLSGHIIAGAIKQSKKYNYKVKDLNEKQCVIEFFENSESQGDYVFTIDDARKAKLTDKYIWKTNTKDMLFNRCISGGYKKFCPDVIGLPVYAEGEFADAEVVDNTPQSPLTKRGGNHNNSPSSQEGDKGGVGNSNSNEPQVVNADDILNKAQDTAKKPDRSKKKRPMSVEYLIESYKKYHDYQPATEDELQDAEKALLVSTNNNTGKVNALLDFFTGQHNIHNLTSGECKFFVKWLAWEEDETGASVPIDMRCLEEVDSVLKAAESCVTKEKYSPGLFEGGNNE